MPDFDKSVAELIERAGDLAPCVVVVVTLRDGSGQAAGLVLGNLPVRQLGEMMGQASARIMALTAKTKATLSPADRAVFMGGFVENLSSIDAGETRVRTVRRDPNVGKGGSGGPQGR